MIAGIALIIFGGFLSLEIAHPARDGFQGWLLFYIGIVVASSGAANIAVILST